MFVIAIEPTKASQELARQISHYLAYHKQPQVLYASNILYNAEKDILISVGSDRFLLKMLHSFSSNIPIISFYDGASFFAEANTLTMKRCLDSLLRKQYSLVHKTRLVADIGGKLLPSALNEIGVFPRISASLMRYSLVMNGTVFWKDTADGFMVSTPTGSTGYSLSLGGPIMVYDPLALSLNPVSSLDKNHTSLVVPETVSVRLEQISSSSLVEVIIDGDLRIPLKGDHIEIKKSDQPVVFVRLVSELAVQKKLRQRSRTWQPSKLKGLSPSAKLVYKTLTYEGELTQKEIIQETHLPPRTVRYALEVLMRKGLIISHEHLKDVRQKIYTLV